MEESNYIEIDGNECVYCVCMRELGRPPTINDIIKCRKEPWPNTCDLHLRVLDDMKQIFGDS